MSLIYIYIEREREGERERERDRYYIVLLEQPERGPRVAGEEDRPLNQ